MLTWRVFTGTVTLLAIPSYIQVQSNITACHQVATMKGQLNGTNEYL